GVERFLAQCGPRGRHAALVLLQLTGEPRHAMGLAQRPCRSQQPRRTDVVPLIRSQSPEPTEDPGRIPLVPQLPEDRQYLVEVGVPQSEIPLSRGYPRRKPEREGNASLILEMTEQSVTLHRQRPGPLAFPSRHRHDCQLLERGGDPP